MSKRIPVYLSEEELKAIIEDIGTASNEGQSHVTMNLYLKLQEQLATLKE